MLAEQLGIHGGLQPVSSRADRPCSGAAAACASCPGSGTWRRSWAWLASSPAAFWLAGCQCSTASQSLKSPAADEKRFGAAAFLGRAAMIAQRAAKQHPDFSCSASEANAGGGRRDAEEVVAATVAGRKPGPRPPLGHVFLREARQRVEFAKIATTGLPAPTVAINAVGIPATPRSTRNPAASEQVSPGRRRAFPCSRPRPIPRSSAFVPMRRRPAAGSIGRGVGSPRAGVMATSNPENCNACG